MFQCWISSSLLADIDLVMMKTCSYTIENTCNNSVWKCAFTNPLKMWCLERIHTKCTFESNIDYKKVELLICFRKEDGAVTLDVIYMSFFRGSATPPDHVIWTHQPQKRLRSSYWQTGWDFHGISCGSALIAVPFSMRFRWMCVCRLVHGSSTYGKETWAIQCPLGITHKTTQTHAWITMTPSFCFYKYNKNVEFRLKDQHNHIIFWEKNLQSL